MLLTNDEHFELTFKIPARGGSRGGKVEGVATPPLGRFQACLVTYVYPVFISKIILYDII